MNDTQLNDEQKMIRDSVSAYLRDRYDDAERRRISDSDAGWDEAHWRSFSEELGLLAAGFSEDLGGLGGGIAEHALILEEFGKALVCEPYFSTAVIGGGFLKYGTHDDANTLIERMIAGKIRTAFAHGEPGTRNNIAHVTTIAEKTGDGYRINGIKAVVVDAPFATHLIVTARTSGGPRDHDGLSAFLIDIDAAGVTRRDYSTISGGRASEINLENVTALASDLLAEEGKAFPLIDRVMDEATLLYSAEIIGALSRLLDDTVAYTKERKQFGATLSSFQALQHRMTDMFMQLTLASAMVSRACSTLPTSAEERAKQVSATKVFVAKTARFVGQNAVQLHGGMGMTDELALGFFFKRANEYERRFGTSDYHLTRFEKLGSAAAAA